MPRRNCESRTEVLGRIERGTSRKILGKAYADEKRRPFIILGLCLGWKGK